MKQQKINIPKQAVDFGTPELVHKRMSLVKNADPAMAEHPLAVLHVTGFLNAQDSTQSQKMYHAGMAFGMIWGRVFKQPYSQSQLSPFLPGSTGGEWSEKQMIAANKKLREVRDRMKERKVYDALVNCVVYRRPPLRMGDKATENELGNLRLALCRLMQIDLSIDNANEI